MSCKFSFKCVAIFITMIIELQSPNWQLKCPVGLRRNPIEDGAISGFTGKKSVPE